MIDEDKAKLLSRKREKASIQQQQRRVILPPRAGGFKKVPSTEKQFDWQLRLDSINREIATLQSN